MKEFGNVSKRNNDTYVKILNRLQEDVFNGINLFEAVLFTITTIVGIIVFILQILLLDHKESDLYDIMGNVITLIDIPLGVIAATFLSKRNKLAPLLLCIDALFYGSANFIAGNIALGLVNAVATPLLYCYAFIWVWPKEIKDDTTGEIETRKLSIVSGFVVVLSIIIVSVLFGLLLPVIFDNAFTSTTYSDKDQWLNIYKTWFDAFAASLMLMAVISSVYRFRETFFLYLFSNIMKIILFTTTVAIGYPGDSLLLVLALAYFINAIFGILIWNQSEVFKLKKANK